MKDTKKETIEKTLRKHKPFLMKKFHVKNIGIFGSIVKGEMRPEEVILIYWLTLKSLLVFLISSGWKII